MKPPLMTVLIVAAVAFVAGLGTCQLSQTPPDLTLADSLAATRADWARDRTVRDALLAAEQAEVARQKAWGDSVAREARSAQNRANQAGHRTREAESALAGAATVRDSVDRLVVLAGSLRTERDEWRTTAGQWEASAGARADALARLTGAVDSLRRADRADLEARLEAQERAVDGLRRQVRGCRVPLIGVRCPKVGVGYGAGPTDGQVSHGPVVAVIIPIA